VKEQMQEAYSLAARFDDVVLAEQFISGRELTVPVLGTGKDARALPVIEIVAPEGTMIIRTSISLTIRAICALRH
jgi:D-alanine-D-alanine ligase